MQKMILAVFLWGCLAFWTVQPGEVAALEIPIKSFTLENGLTLLVWEDHSAPTLSFQVHFAAGSRDERPGITGIAHLFEHLMFKGTENLKPEEFSRIIQAHGGRVNAFTTKDNTTYFENLPADQLELAARLEAERISRLILDRENLDTEREVVRSERRMRTVNSPEGLVYEQLYATAYDQHPYQWPIIGWDSDIQAITLEEAREFYRTYYAPNNAVVVVVGDVKADEVLAVVRRHFGGLARQEPPVKPRTVERPQLGEKRVSVHRVARLPAFYAGYHVPGIVHEDIYPLMVASTALSQGHTARLYRKFVRTGRATGSSASVGTLPFVSADPGLLLVHATAAPGVDMDTLEKEVLAEVEALAEAPLPADELAKAKKQLRAQFFLSLQSNFFKGLIAGFFQVRGGDWKQAAEIPGGLESVTAADVQRVMKKYIHPANRTVARLVPIEQDHPLAEQLQ